MKNDFLAGGMEKTKGSVSIDIFLPFLKLLIKQYGNFKMSENLYSIIVENLAEICDEIENIKNG